MLLFDEGYGKIIVSADIEDISLKGVEDMGYIWNRMTGHSDCSVKKLFLFASSVILFIFALSFWDNANGDADQEPVRRTMVNDTFMKLNNISDRLDDLLLELDNQASDSDVCENKLTLLACDFTQLHTILKYYSMWFQTNSTYTDAINFEFIASTLIYGTGEVNSNLYSGILEDGVISEEEIHYLSILKDDVDGMIASMTSSDNPPQENSELTTIQMDYILNSFFDKWSWHKENNPFHLLYYKREAGF
ncbi:MAG: hypothetical protein Q4F28_02560 [Eubacteriales bacterium]|nr:hypothetical protein [Eubacteriales bacterium]